MVPDRLLAMVGQPGGPLADASLWPLQVVAAGPLTPSLRRVVLSAPTLDTLVYTAGQDLMLRVPVAGERVLNRRYTIRAFDPAQRTVTIDVSLHGAGPGTDWVSAAQEGDRIEAIGPRGKITPRSGADWHLFVVDETGLPGALAMLEALPRGSTANAVLEVDGAADEQVPVAPKVERLELRWLHRDGQSAPGDASAIVEAVAGLELPNGDGHAYIAAEASVVRSVVRLLHERGLQPEQISGKAYWRRGLPNAEHGEPTKEG
jgi:NADPH-dependent ferric siderophore reductase